MIRDKYKIYKKRRENKSGTMGQFKDFKKKPIVVQKALSILSTINNRTLIWGFLAAGFCPIVPLNGFNNNPNILMLLRWSKIEIIEPDETKFIKFEDLQPSK